MRAHLKMIILVADLLKNWKVGVEMGSKISVLIVEDNPQVRKDLCSAIALDERIEISGEAATGIEALQAAEQRKPDVVLMDLEMPEMDGYEATRLIKTRQLSKAVIILTVHGYPAARQRAESAGADAFIVKGAALQDMLDTIENVARKQKE